MKKVLFLLLMVAAFVACSDDDDNNDDKQEKLLIGTWIEDTDRVNEVFHWQFNSDYSGYKWATDDGEVDKLGKMAFTWSISKTSLHIEFGKESTTYKFEISEGNLLMSYDGEALTYKKE